MKPEGVTLETAASLYMTVETTNLGGNLIRNMRQS